MPAIYCENFTWIYSLTSESGWYGARLYIILFVHLISSHRFHNVRKFYKSINGQYTFYWFFYFHAQHCELWWYTWNDRVRQLNQVSQMILISWRGKSISIMVWEWVSFINYRHTFRNSTTPEFAIINFIKIFAYHYLIFNW